MGQPDRELAPHSAADPGPSSASASHPPASGALAHDAAAKRKLRDRLRRIEGQVRGLQRMVEENRYCPDVLQQISAVQASLGGVAEALLRGHLRHCVTDAIRAGEPHRAESIYEELAELYRKHGR